MDGYQYSTVGLDDLTRKRVREGYEELRKKQELDYISDRLYHNKLDSPHQIISDATWLKFNPRPVRAPADEKDWEREWKQRQQDIALVEQDKNVRRTYPMSILDNKSLSGRDSKLDLLLIPPESVASKSVASEQSAIRTHNGKKQRIKGGKKLKIKAKPKATPKAKPKATPKAKPKATPKATPKAKPKASPKASPKAKPKATPKASPKATPKAKPKATPKAKPKAK